MISEGSFTNDPGRRTRIEKVVEKETRRRKRLLILYGLILVIPFGVGVGFLIYGHSDREVLKTEVNRRLAPVEATINQTEPALQQVRDMAVRVSAQEERLDRLSREQELNTSIAAGKEVPIRSLKKELADMDNRLTLQDKLLAGIENRLTLQDMLLAGIENRLTLQDELLATFVDGQKMIMNEYNNVLQEHNNLLERLRNELKLLTKRKIGRQSNPRISSK